MDNGQRKSETRRRLKQGKHPRRADALFTDKNDHNPSVLADCPRCSSRGKICREEQEGDTHTISLEVCQVCSGTGSTEQITRYFENETPAIDVEESVEGWIKCPCCGWKFATKDSNVWTEYRHKRCGQKLKII